MVTYYSSTGSVPVISSGSGAPSSTPVKVGDLYVDTSAARLYFAAATSSSGDWKQVLGS